MWGKASPSSNLKERSRSLQQGLGLKGGSNGCLCLIPQLCQDTCCLWASPAFCSLCLNGSLSTAPPKPTPPPICCFSSESEVIDSFGEPEGMDCPCQLRVQRTCMSRAHLFQSLGALPASCSVASERRAEEGREGTETQCLLPEHPREKPPHPRKALREDLLNRGEKPASDASETSRTTNDDISPREDSCRPAQEPRRTVESLPTPSRPPTHLQSTSLPGS